MVTGFFNWSVIKIKELRCNHLMNYFVAIKNNAVKELPNIYTMHAIY